MSALSLICHSLSNSSHLDLYYFFLSSSQCSSQSIYCHLRVQLCLGLWNIYMVVYAAPLWGNALGWFNHWRQYAKERSISLSVYVCRYEHQQTILKEELAKVAQRESEEMTKARTRERLQTRLEAEKTRKLVRTHSHTHTHTRTHTHTHTHAQSLLSITASSSFLYIHTAAGSVLVPHKGSSEYWAKFLSRWILITQTVTFTWRLKWNTRHLHLLVQVRIDGIKKSAAQLSAAVWHLVCVSLIVQQIRRKLR